MKKIAIIAAAIVAIAAVVFFLTRRDVASTGNTAVVDATTRRVEKDVNAYPPREASCVAGAMRGASRRVEDDEDQTRQDVASTTNEPQTEEKRREAEEEKLVNDFDDLTDKWMEPSAKGVTMADIDNFVKSFRKIPKARQDECVHRALNLIPDENVMLLAGVLMDKSMDKEIVETVYNDILNRDEDVKKPILQQIFKDKSHPCWTDTAWILDVTGELPKAK